MVDKQNTGAALDNAAQGTIGFAGVNFHHKDTVFRDLFGSPENKANALSLYNALRGSAYTDTDLLELTTIDNVLYMSVKNDISFLINDEMILWEHQSTHNPNMPLRGLNYFARLFTAWVDRQDRSIYGRTLIELPTPRYYVFFTGEEHRPDREEMRLSDAFSHGPGDVEVIVTVINANADHNPQLMAACETLAGYAYLVKLIREYSKGQSLASAIDRAVQQCIDEGALADYLRNKRAKVKDMFLTEYDEARTMRQLREEAIKEGLAEGRAEGRAEGLAEGRARERCATLEKLVGLYAAGTLSEQDVMGFGFTKEEMDAALAEVG